jgi:hypothetical protein
MVDEWNMNMEKVGKILTRLFVAKPATVPMCPPKAPTCDRTLSSAVKGRQVWLLLSASYRYVQYMQCHCTVIQNGGRQVDNNNSWLNGYIMILFIRSKSSPLTSNIIRFVSVMSSKTPQAIRSILQSCGSTQLQKIGYTCKFLGTAWEAVRSSTYFCVLQQAKSGPGRLVVEVSTTQLEPRAQSKSSAWGSARSSSRYLNN